MHTHVFTSVCFSPRESCYHVQIMWLLSTYCVVWKAYYVAQRSTIWCWYPHWILVVNNSSPWCYHCVVVVVPGSNTSLDGGFSTMMMMMLGWLVIATALFLFRPQSLRGRGDSKPAGGGGNVSEGYRMKVKVINWSKVRMDENMAQPSFLTAKCWPQSLPSEWNIPSVARVTPIK